MRWKSAAATARLPGRVQGVVVQIATAAPRAASGPRTTGKRTNTVVDSRSRYSISASARAVRSTGDHITGFAPRYRPPFIRNLKSSRTIWASAANDIVV